MKEEDVALLSAVLPVCRVLTANMLLTEFFTVIEYPLMVVRVNVGYIVRAAPSLSVRMMERRAQSVATTLLKKRERSSTLTNRREEAERRMSVTSVV